MTTVARADRSGGVDVGAGFTFNRVNVAVGGYVYLKQQGTDQDDRATSSVIVLDRADAEALALTILASLNPHPEGPSH
jgi:hypothetical protein